MTAALPPKYDPDEAYRLVLLAIRVRFALLEELGDFLPGEDLACVRARCELGQILDGDSGRPDLFPVVELMRLHLRAYREAVEDDSADSADSVDPESTSAMRLCVRALDRALETENPEEALWNDEEVPPIDCDSLVRMGIDALGDPALAAPPKRSH